MSHMLLAGRCTGSLGTSRPVYHPHANAFVHGPSALMLQHQAQRLARVRASARKRNYQDFGSMDSLDLDALDSLDEAGMDFLGGAAGQGAANGAAPARAGARTATKTYTQQTPYQQQQQQQQQPYQQQQGSYQRQQQQQYTPYQQQQQQQQAASQPARAPANFAVDEYAFEADYGGGYINGNGNGGYIYGNGNGNANGGYANGNGNGNGNGGYVNGNGNGNGNGGYMNGKANGKGAGTGTAAGGGYMNDTLDVDQYGNFAGGFGNYDDLGVGFGGGGGGLYGGGYVEPLWGAGGGGGYIGGGSYGSGSYGSGSYIGERRTTRGGRSSMKMFFDDPDEIDGETPVVKVDSCVINGRTLQCNHGITAKEVFVLGAGPEKAPLGAMPLARALALAEEAKEDLLLVNPDASPPVARIVDWSKYKFELEKSAKAKKAKSVTVETKEVRLRPSTDSGDLAVKLKSCTKFLTKGDRVKLVMKFEGREVQFKEQGKEVLLNFISELASVAKVEGPLNFKTGTYTIMLAPNKP